MKKSRKKPGFLRKKTSKLLTIAGLTTALATGGAHYLYNEAESAGKFMRFCGNIIPVYFSDVTDDVALKTHKYLKNDKNKKLSMGYAAAAALLLAAYKVSRKD